MRFLIKDIATDYEFNDLVERYVANMLENLSGYPKSDFGIPRTPRPEYDYRVGGMPIEQKVTSGIEVPIETHKDLERTIGSGLTTSTAEWFMVIMDGLGDGVGCGKIRMYSAKTLRNVIHRPAVCGHPKFYPGDTPSQGATIQYLKPFNAPHIWIGNVDKIVENHKTIGYDLGTFVPAPGAGDVLRNMIEEFKQDQVDRGLT